MNLECLPEARAEFHAAAAYYEAKEDGLGKRFGAEILEACTTISAHPPSGGNGKVAFDE